MFKYEMDTRQFTQSMTALERTKLPVITAFALNEAAWAVRQGWREEMNRVFDRPTPLTLNAVLFRKATKHKLVAEVFIRNEASKGTPPSKYLYPEVTGGPRGQKAFERRLEQHPRGRSFYVPGRQAPRDAYGNVPARVISQILSQLAVRQGAYQNETQVSRARAQRRQQRRGGGGRYFIAKPGRRGVKPGAVYERIETGFGSAIRTVLFPLHVAPTYRPRFNATQVARVLMNKHFKKEFINAMQRVLQR